MTRTVTLHVEGFAAKALQRLMSDGRASPDGVFRTAGLYYLNDRDSGRPAWHSPRFRPSQGVERKGLSVAFDDETWAALEEEARRQRLDPEDLAVHALLYYVADLQSGRVSERLEEALEEQERPSPADREP